jgi:hypothetical protein
MSDHHKEEQWLRDVRDRQRNIVFPDTVDNEARFWRNLGKQPFTTPTKVGLALLAILGWGTVAVVLVAAFHEGVIWRIALVMLLLWGPILGAIAWATHRSLRQNARRNPLRRKH